MSFYMYVLVMAGVTWLIRVIPLVLIRKEINNKFIKSFLYYVPYVTLSIMTFPAIIDATNSIWSGIAALIVGVLLAYFVSSLFTVSVMSCVTVFVLELFIK